MGCAAATDRDASLPRSRVGALSSYLRPRLTPTNTPLKLRPSKSMLAKPPSVERKVQGYMDKATSDRILSLLFGSRRTRPRAWELKSFIGFLSSASSTSGSCANHPPHPAHKFCLLDPILLAIHSTLLHHSLRWTINTYWHLALLKPSTTSTRLVRLPHSGMASLLPWLARERSQFCSTTAVSETVSSPMAALVC